MIPQAIFNYFAENHNLSLTETDYNDILLLFGFQKITEINYPPENTTCFFYNENSKHVFVGVHIYLQNLGWLYAETNNRYYIENNQIVSECDLEDLEEPTHFLQIPQIP